MDELERLKRFLLGVDAILHLSNVSDEDKIESIRRTIEGNFREEIEGYKKENETTE